MSIKDNYKTLTSNPMIARKRRLHPSRATQKLINKVLEYELEDEG